ncbi:Fe-S protein assembly co-chaperone HscB [Rickettsiales bacterium]|nr:Fe-S protein assembly co-chaperone HscB [Rickettsiales bacterium]
MTKKPENLFEILSLQKSFDLDLKKLEENYFACQSQWHPDRFTGKSDAEKLAATQNSVEVNQAYNILKDPRKRAQYMLSLEGIKVNCDDANVKPSQELLIRVMEQRDELSECVDKDKLRELLISADSEKQELIAKIKKDFTDGDLTQAAQSVINLRYIEKYIEEIKQQIK